MAVIATAFILGMAGNTASHEDVEIFWNIELTKKWDKRVYLATYPRSGNFWMRFLIEEATGIATSSVLFEVVKVEALSKQLDIIFPWGGYCWDHGLDRRCRYPMRGEIVVVKTHFPAFGMSLFDALPYSKAIRIVRHPVDSFYSYYCLNKKEENIKFLIPKEVLKRCIQEWRRFQEYWNSTENVLTIRYEDLYNNPHEYLKLVLESIGYRVEQKDIERAVERYPPKGGLYKHFHHFTEEDLLLVQNELGDLMQMYGYNK